MLSRELRKKNPREPQGDTVGALARRRKPDGGGDENQRGLVLRFDEGVRSGMIPVERRGHGRRRLRDRTWIPGR